MCVYQHTVDRIVHTSHGACANTHRLWSMSDTHTPTLSHTRITHRSKLLVAEFYRSKHRSAIQYSSVIQCNPATPTNVKQNRPTLRCRSTIQCNLPNILMTTRMCGDVAGLRHVEIVVFVLHMCCILACTKKNNSWNFA